MRKIVYPILILGFVLFSFAPTLYEISRASNLQPDRSFELVHNFYTDYNFYLSRIRQGMEGRWTVVEKYTSEPHAGSLIHEMYLLMGSVGKAVRVPWWKAGDVYHVARVVLAVALLALIAEFCRKSFSSGLKNYEVRDKNDSLFLHPISYLPFFAFLLAVTASSWPKLVGIVNNAIVPATIDNIANWRFGGYMAWWSVMDSLQRITFIPHLLAGQAFMIFLVLQLTDRMVMKRSGNSVFLGILAFFLGMILPPALLFVIGVIGVFGVISVVWERKIVPAQWISWGGVVFVSASSLLYIALMTSVYPWHRLAEADILHPLPFAYIEYIQALGPIFPIGLLGLIVALFRKEKAMLPAVSWIVAWIGFLFIFQFVPQQSPLRFSEMIPHVPLGILTAYLFFRLSYIKNLGNLSKMAVGTLIVMGLFHMYSSYLWQRDFVDHKIRATYPLVPTGSYVMYPLTDFYMGIVFLKDHTDPSDVILSETTAGNYIPVYSANTVYVGHDNTVHAEMKKERVRAFFSGSMNPDDARVWLLNERIRMIYFGPQEREDGRTGDLRRVYPYLESVYSNAHVIIYNVQ